MARILIEHRRGSAEQLHGADPFREGVPDSPTLWICEVTAPAIVLGSRQTPDLLDLDACHRLGLDVVRRRSGGGAVLLRPGAIVWIDLILPHGIAPDDVRGSMVWAGECWRGALVALGAEPNRLTVHEGALVCTPWSDLVCFSGLGPGELLTGDRKLLGLSQRRTRDGIRVQCQIHRRPLVSTMPALFAVTTPPRPPDDPAELSDVVDAATTDADLAAALADAIIAAG